MSYCDALWSAATLDSHLFDGSATGDLQPDSLPAATPVGTLRWMKATAALNRSNLVDSKRLSG
ncbi:hypothetical protein KL86DES1_21925 [uncultured Desulfovibrio sp.]|uniref:Uncharacterized protein n=1 Tax=uncultured Desulfovibrio sp. TaxID=167968 RepID=A0A212LA49_9BACT|nr:hypothetical protein KL86DES1_21925 [uncultured Desulfovibrio sp.]VZH34822.1 conserved protein of unknown function [Desulfovibrio sp. 86]